MATANGMAGITQKYSISYSTGNSTQAKSGNPGYIPGFPLLLGSQNALNSSAIDTYQDGFRLVGADSNGRCTSGQSVYMNGDPVVNFLENVIYGC